MGSVDAIGGSNVPTPLTSTTAMHGTSRGHHRHHRAAIDSAAGALGMDPKDVMSALQTGKSLDDLAQEKGVSHDDLISAIKAGLPQGVQQSGRANQIAESVATRTGAPRPPAPPVGAPAGGSPAGSISGVLGYTLDASQQATLDGLSSLLGTTSDDLLSSLRGGTNLGQLLDDKGVDRDQLASVLQDGLMVDTSA